MTMSYYLPPRKLSPNYNVMAVAKAGLECTVRYLAWNLGPRNIRVNAVSAGPIKALAARGVGDLHRDDARARRTRSAASQRGPA